MIDGTINHSLFDLPQTRAWRWCCLLLLLCAPFGLCQVQKNTASVIEISGADDLLPLLQTHLQIIRLSRDNPLSQAELQRLANITPQEIKDLLATEGYFSANVTGSVEQQAGQPLAHFRITLGKPTLIRHLDLVFEGAITQDPARMAKLRQSWQLPAGSVFRQVLWDGAKKEVLRALLVRDYPAAKLTESRAAIDPENNSAQLLVSIDSGPQFTFGALEIHGLQRYPAQMIEQINTIRPGEAYSQERLSELQARVLDTAYFRSVFATINPDPAQANQVPIRLDVTEMESKRLGLGLGFSTDSGARGQIKWLDRRLLGHDWRLEAVLRIDQQTQLLGGDLYFPALQNGVFGGFLQGWIPSLGSSIERTTLTGTELEKIRNIARLSTPSRNNERVLSVALLADRRSIPDAEAISRRALLAGYSYVLRRLDQPVTPRAGYVAGIELQAGVGGVLNQDNISRLLVHGIWLRPLGSDWTTILRMQAGEVFGVHNDSVPEDLLFRTGGDQSVRGYAFGSLGVPRYGAIVGGNVMAVFSAEVVYQITPQWGIALFSDIGDAASSRQSFVWKQGSGLGGRWRSPVGPVNLDLARAHDSGEVRLHFSVGYGF
ncbi:MAG: autotransporter assembly complex family protein [Burkholderiaceae bacterium]